MNKCCPYAFRHVYCDNKHYVQASEIGGTGVWRYILVCHLDKFEIAKSKWKYFKTSFDWTLQIISTKFGKKSYHFIYALIYATM